MKLVKPEDLSDYVLLAANFVPAAGVLLWGWDALAAVGVYWLESIVVGGFGALKMLCVTFLKPAYQGLFLTPLFCVVYSIFTAVQGVFIFLMFDKTSHAHKSGSINGDDMNTLLSVHGLSTAVAALTAHHAFSFFYNFLGKRDYKTADIMAVMGKPIRRLGILQFTLLAGFFVVAMFGSPAWAVFILTLLKTKGDLALHKQQPAQAAAKN